jgi:hypothetical protein
MLASLIGSLISGEAIKAARRARIAAIVYLVVAVLAAVGLGFLIGAGYIVAARRFGSLAAALGFGLGFVLAAAIVLAVHAIGAARRRRRRDRLGAELATLAGAAAVTLVPVLLRSRAGLLGPLIAVAAYAIYRENSKDRPGDPDRDDG